MGYEETYSGPVTVRRGGSVEASPLKAFPSSGILACDNF